MPRVCKVTGKKTEVGMNVSHSNRRTKRTFLPNLQTLKFHSDILGRDFSLRISTAGLRTLTKHGGLDAYVMAKPVSRLTADMAAIKKAIAYGNPVLINCITDKDDCVVPTVPARAAISDAFDAEDLKNKK